MMVQDLIWLLYITIVEIFRPLYKAVFGAQVKDVKGKTVLITGAARGLGRELALQFSKLGSTIICVDVNSEDNKETLKLLDDSKCRAYTCDVSSQESVAQLHEDVKKDVGHVDILVNNAGIMAVIPLREGTPEVIRRIVEVNILSHIWMIREFVPDMIERKCGHIAAISSLAGLAPVPEMAVYSATKYAVVGLMGAFFHELREMSKYIKLTVACPWAMETDIAVKSFERTHTTVPIIPIDVAAKEIIQGIREEKFIFTVHKWWEFLIKFANLLPFNILLPWAEFLFGKMPTFTEEFHKEFKEAYNFK